MGVVLVQKRDLNGLLAACMAVIPIHGNVSTLLVISKAVRACLTDLSHLPSLFSVMLTGSSLLLSPCGKTGGGCAIPLTPYTHLGEDCSAIPGVADVACLYGKCVVSRCLPGLEPSHDGHSCVRRYPQLDDELDVSASVYGLEHVPLAGALGRQ